MARGVGRPRTACSRSACRSSSRSTCCRTPRRCASSSPGRCIALLHKWTMRTCFNAQEEIYLASMDEVAQVRAVASAARRATSVRRASSATASSRRAAPRARNSAACPSGATSRTPCGRCSGSATLAMRPAHAGHALRGRFGLWRHSKFAYGRIRAAFSWVSGDSAAKPSSWISVCFCHRRFRTRMSAITCWYAMIFRGGLGLVLTRCERFHIITSGFRTHVQQPSARQRR